MAGVVVDVNEASFAKEVIEASHELPVIVDFWASWCGPCRVLGPILEAISEEHGGEVLLAKVDVDANPGLASRYGISGIPAVKAFVAGELVSEFIGALPESQVRDFFASLVSNPTGDAVMAAVAAREAGNLLEARRLFDEALESDPRHEEASLGLAELLIESGAPAEAERASELAQRFDVNPRARRVMGLVRFTVLSSALDEAELLTRIAKDESDAEAHYRLGELLASRSEWGAAAEELLVAVQLDRDLDNDGARRALLGMFNVLGDRHSLTEEYRRRLASVIF